MQDGAGNALSSFTILDRGYTGHEHLLGVGLVHMNGRLYDPKLHRFLMPDNFVQDPYNTQNFNRYGYVLNNPLSYTDASGEFFWFAFGIGAIIGAVTGAAGYIAHAIVSGNWSWGQFSLSVIGGALIGGLSGGIAPSSAMTGSAAEAFLYAGGAFAAGLLPSANFSLGNWNFSISPSIALGNGFGAGASFSASFSDGHFSFSGGVGVTYYGNYSGLGISGTEFRKSLQATWDDGGKGLTLGTNFWSGSGGLSTFKQQTGKLGFRSGDFGLTYENDGSPFQKKWLLGGVLGDGMDRFRTAALTVSVGEYSAGFNLITGSRTDYSGDEAEMLRGLQYGRYNERLPNGFVKEDGYPFRMGVAYFSFKNFRLGANSDRYIRHPIQDIIAHGLFAPQPGFYSYSNAINPFFQYKTPNRFTSW